MPENDGVIISCSKIGQKENGKLDIKTITSTFIIKHREGMPAKALDPNRALVEVGNIFAFMHSPLAEMSYFNDIDERNDTIEQRMATKVNETKLTFFWDTVFSLFLEF